MFRPAYDGCELFTVSVPQMMLRNKPCWIAVLAANLVLALHGGIAVAQARPAPPPGAGRVSFAQLAPAHATAVVNFNKALAEIVWLTGAYLPATSPE